MKRIFALLLALLLLTLTACAGVENTAPTQPTTTATTTVATSATTASTEITTETTTTVTTLPTTVITTTAERTTKTATTTAATTRKTAVTTKATAAPATTTTKATTTKAATTTAKTTAAPSDTDVYAIGEYMTKLINRERAAEGLAPLVHRADLQRYADIRTKEIQQSFSHTRPDGTDCFTVFGNEHFWAMGENIAMGQRTVVEVMEDWMNSPGHRRNILSSDFNGVIIGFENYHWVQLFVRE